MLRLAATLVTLSIVGSSLAVMVMAIALLATRKKPTP